MRIRHLAPLFVFLVALAPLGSAVLHAAEPGIPTFVHYCNWHGKLGNQNSWQFATTLPLYSDGRCVIDPTSPTGFDCFTGYNSSDATTIEHHNAEFTANGLVPLISWWGRVGTPNDYSGDLFLDQYLAVPSPVKAGLLYEVTGLLVKTRIGTLPDGRPHEVYDFGSDANSENAQRFISDVTYLHQKYLLRQPARFYTIDGRPVLFIWLSHAFYGRFDLAVAELRKTVPVYIIGSDFGVYAPNDHNPLISTIRGLDAVSAYSIYDGQRTTKYNGHMSAEWVNEYVISVFAWNAWLRVNAPQVKLILPTTFTYHDSRGTPVLDKTTPAEARYLADMVRALIEQGRAGCTSVLPFVLHVSYNEHYEGTSIEPSFRNRLVYERNGLKMGEDYGDSFLKIFPAVFGPPLAPAPTCPAP